MPTYRVTVETKSANIYEIEAKNEKEAKEKALDLYNNGEEGDQFSDIIDGPDDGSDVKVEKLND